MERSGVQIWDFASIVFMPNFVQGSVKQKNSILGNDILSYLKAHLESIFQCSL